MSFGDIFGKTWKEYCANFWANLGLFFVFYVLPVLVAVGVLSMWFFGSGLHISADLLLQQGMQLSDVSEAELASESIAILSEQFLSGLRSFFVEALSLLIAAVVFVVVLGFLGIYAHVTILAGSLHAPKYSFAQAIRAARGKYWRMVGLFALLMLLAMLFAGIFAAMMVSLGFFTGDTASLVLGIFTIFVLVLLVSIVMIWIGVQWMFAPFILIAGKESVFGSLGASSRLVKGRWWKTFGYLMLFYLILMVPSIFFSLIDTLSRVAVSAFWSISAGGDSLVLAFFAMFGVSLVIQMISALILTPFTILFMKNFYLAWKR